MRLKERYPKHKPRFDLVVLLLKEPTINPQWNLGTLREGFIIFGPQVRHVWYPYRFKRETNSRLDWAAFADRLWQKTRFKSRLRIN